MDLHLHLSLNHRGCLGTTDDFTASLLHFALFSTALWDLANSRPVHFLMSSFSVYGLPYFTVPCIMVLARIVNTSYLHNPEIYIFTMVRRCLCTPIACWILMQTPLLVTWSLYEMCSILR